MIQKTAIQRTSAPSPEQGVVFGMAALVLSTTVVYAMVKATLFLVFGTLS